MFINKNELIKQREREIKQNGNYVTYEIICPTIPHDVLKKIGEEEVNANGEVMVGTMVIKSLEYIEKDLSCQPIFHCRGRDISLMDRLIALHELRGQLDKYENKLLNELRKLSEEE